MSAPNLTAGDYVPILNTSAFERLYWSILDPEGISTIRVAEENENAAPASRASFTTHPIALEPATKTGASKLLVTAECLGYNEGHWNDGFEEPEEGVENLEDAWDYVLVKTEDGSPLLVRDVVIQLHAWAANPFIGDKLREALVWMYNSVFERQDDGYCALSIGADGDVNEVLEGTRIFFEQFVEWGPEQDNDILVLAVNLWVEGYQGESAEHFWKSRANPGKYQV
jgi:hypothetical protein